MGRDGVRDLVDEQFAGPLGSRWSLVCPGGANVESSGGVLRLALAAHATARAYSDAQIDDYSTRSRSRFLWRPPLRMEIRAHASHPAHPPTAPAARSDADAQPFLRGTTGFGFWNYPLTLAGGLPRLPDAVWFFGASPPSNMALVPGVAGWGWKAQVVHANRPAALLAGAPALAAILRARVTGKDADAAKWVHRVTGASEAPLTADLSEWHDYALEWRTDAARFWVDGTEVLVAPDPPRGPLGFVAWVDNMYAIATPRGAFRFGLVDSEPEWLELSCLHIEPLE